MANIRQVASAAGVSTASVSRYLAGQKVKAEQQISRAIDELGYSPSDVARSLKSGRHGSIGVIVPDITNPFFAGLVKGIDQEARAAGYQVILGNSDEDAEQQQALLAAFIKRSDGIIIAPLVEEDRSVPWLDSPRLPVVLVDRALAHNDRFDRVITDNIAGSRLAVDHLAGLGHTSIAFISGPLGSTPGRARHEGFVAAMAANQIDVRDELVKISDFRQEGGYRSMQQLWQVVDRPSAVFVANNLMTIGTLNALNDIGVGVPHDISVIGFDDLSFAALLNPPLTVIHRDDLAQGATAARLLIERLNGQDPELGRSVTLPVDLIVRGSTGEPRQKRSAR